jgi:hypothetical protein
MILKVSDSGLWEWPERICMSPPSTSHHIESVLVWSEVNEVVRAMMSNWDNGCNCSNFGSV